MIQEPKKFVSYIESRIEDNNNLYARFHLGSFIGGQALTIANALRRTLLAEIPAFVITRIEIDGVNHEFATLPGIEESILNIVLNLKKILKLSFLFFSHFFFLSFSFIIIFYHFQISFIFLLLLFFKHFLFNLQ